MTLPPPAARPIARNHGRSGGVPPVLGRANVSLSGRQKNKKEILPSDIDLDPPVSHAIADGWAAFAESVLPSVIGGTERAQAPIAFHFGAMYVLQILEHVVALRLAEEAALALSTLGAELDE